jgi:branched-chain amino acid transport system substrate-binding protein
MKRVISKVLLPGLMVLVLMVPLFTAWGCGSSSDDNNTVAPATTAAISTPSNTATAQPTVNPNLDTYKIGAVFAVNGNNAPLGLPEKNVANMLEKQINDAGGINGHKVSIIVYDTESDTTKCVLLVKKLIDEDKVSAIVGPTSSGESVALLDTVTKAEIPLISCAASYKIVEPIADRYWVFSTPQKDKTAADTLFAYIQKQGITKVATICDTAGFGQSGKGALELEAPNYGITIVDEESFGTQDPDMSTQLTKIKGTDAQAIICWGTNPGPAVIAKNVKTLGITIPLYNSHGIANQQFITLAGDAANGVIFPAGKITGLDHVADNDPQKPALTKFVADYQAAYNTFPNPYAGHAWDAITMVAMAMKAVGNDKAAIRNYLENNIKAFAGISGVFTMSPQDHNGLGSGAFLMIKVVDGKWTVIPQ